MRTISVESPLRCEGKDTALGLARFSPSFFFRFIRGIRILGQADATATAELLLHERHTLEFCEALTCYWLYALCLLGHNRFLFMPDAHPEILSTYFRIRQPTRQTSGDLLGRQMSAY